MIGTASVAYTQLHLHIYDIYVAYMDHPVFGLAFLFSIYSQDDSDEVHGL